MENKVWLVVRERHTTDNDSFVILGVYEEFLPGRPSIKEVKNFIDKCKKVIYG